MNEIETLQRIAWSHVRALAPCRPLYIEDATPLEQGVCHHIAVDLRKAVLRANKKNKEKKT